MANPPNRDQTFADGRGFWERARLIYNALLALLSLGYFLTRLPGSRELLTTDTAITFLFLAIGANILYSAAYAAEFIIQNMLPPYSARPARIVLFLGGTVFACFLAGFALDFLSLLARGD